MNLRLPDDEGKLQVLQQRARALGIELPQDVQRYLIKHSKRDMGSLLTMLEQLKDAAFVAKRRITVPLAREILSSRLDCHKVDQSYINVYDLLGKTGITLPKKLSIDFNEIETLTRKQLLYVRKKLVKQIKISQEKKPYAALLRHLLRQIGRMDQLIIPAQKEADHFERLTKSMKA